MSLFRSWVPWALLGGAAGMAVVGQPLFGAILLVAGLLGAVVATISRTKRAYERDPMEGLSLDSQARLRPLLKAQREIQTIVEQSAGHPVVKVIGGETLVEAEAIISKAAKLLASRTEMLRAGPTDDTDRIDALRAQVEISTDLVEQERLQTALALAEGAQDHHERRRGALNRIDSQLEEARSSLETIAAELGAALTDHTGAESDLRDHLTQIQSLGTSLDESVELLKRP